MISTLVRFITAALPFERLIPNAHMSSRTVCTPFVSATWHRGGCWKISDIAGFSKSCSEKTCSADLRNTDSSRRFSSGSRWHSGVRYFRLTPQRARGL